MLDQILVGIRGVILRDALQSVEQVSGADLDEAVDADIADIRAVPVVPVASLALMRENHGQSLVAAG